MKKHLIIAAAAVLGAMSLQAQPNVLKEAERAMKDGKTPAEVVAIITPAFTDPATDSLAQTYFIPGKSMFSQYDEFYALKQFNKLPENGDLTMANDLLGGYDYFMRALPLDYIPNEKGKIKPKYSKEIYNTLAGHYGDYNTAALIFWEAKDFANAYNSWQIFLNLVDNPVVRPMLSSVPADTVLGEICYNQAIAAWQAENLPAALKAFQSAKARGYNKKQLYDYAIAVAANMQDDEAAYNWALEAQPLYGSEDPSYIGFIINHFLVAQEFDKAFNMINEAIANDPDNAQYYLVKGILYDNQKNMPEARAMFEKAVSLDNQNWQALYQLGRSLCEEAYALSDSAPTSPAESQAFFETKIVPLFKQAAEYLEQSWNINNDNTDALRYLDNVYYNLRDEANKKDVEQRMAAAGMAVD